MPSRYGPQADRRWSCWPEARRRGWLGSSCKQTQSSWKCRHDMGHRQTGGGVAGQRHGVGDGWVQVVSKLSQVGNAVTIWATGRPEVALLARGTASGMVGFKL